MVIQVEGNYAVRGSEIELNGEEGTIEQFKFELNGDELLLHNSFLPKRTYDLEKTALRRMGSTRRCEFVLSCENSSNQGGEESVKP